MLGIGEEADASEIQTGGMLIGINPQDQKCLLTEAWMASVVSGPVCQLGGEGKWTESC